MKQQVYEAKYGAAEARSYYLHLGKCRMESTGERFVKIKPSGVDYDLLKPEDILSCGFKRKLCRVGNHEPVSGYSDS